MAQAVCGLSALLHLVTRCSRNQVNQQCFFFDLRISAFGICHGPTGVCDWFKFTRGMQLEKGSA